VRRRDAKRAIRSASSAVQTRRVACLPAGARGMPRSGDDAKGIRVVPIAELMGRPPQFAFDHGRIVAAYVARRRRSLRDKSAVGSSPGDDEHEHAYDGSCM
jgi:hypothetical protein